ncbi:MAG: thiamine-phosphate kinase [Myxococcales bacterium]|nr:thiamine-phosphate kinase [Myxococcales bacterium]
MASRQATEEDPDEAFVVQSVRALGGATEGGFGVGDDAAVVGAGDVVTTDTMVEGVHWDHRLAPSDVGWKLVAVNVSDLAAMGARPRWATLAATLPAPLDRGWWQAFLTGLDAALRHWRLPLVGGDTTRAVYSRVLTLTVVGRAVSPVMRSTARVGDEVWVTGELGRSAEAWLRQAPGAGAMAWLRRPEPPVEFGAALAESGLATAMIDLSDGLARDLARLCRASGAGARIDPDLLPGGRPLAESVAFGEDYELCFTADPASAVAICSGAAQHGVTVTRVGAITHDAGPLLVGHARWPASHFDHFSGVPV